MKMTEIWCNIKRLCGSSWKSEKKLFKNNFRLVGLNEFNNTSPVIFWISVYVLITMLAMESFLKEIFLTLGT